MLLGALGAPMHILLLAIVGHADETVPSLPKLLLGSPVTVSDWTLRNPAPAWGPQGIHQILDHAKQCGWPRVYWHCFDGGIACYTSRLWMRWTAARAIEARVA